MSKHEDNARKYKLLGNNCSNSLYRAFSEDTKLDGQIPAPRSIDGKCGALLTALKILLSATIIFFKSSTVVYSTFI